MSLFLNEKDVEHFYRSNIERLTGARFTSPHKTDGFAQWSETRVLLEAKYEAALNTNAGRSAVIAQALYYVQKFRSAGVDCPNVILIGDKSNFFTLSLASVEHFLSENFNWDLPASSPDARLKSAIEAAEIPVFVDAVVFSDISAIVDSCEASANGFTEKLKATPKMLPKMYAHWRDSIFTKDKSMDDMTKIDLFFAIMFHDENEKVFTHPKKKNTIILSASRADETSTKEIKIDVDAMNGFFSRYQRGYAPSEIDAFLAQRDRLIDDDRRRRSGAFFTPMEWADEAHALIRAQLGDDCYSDAIWWDPCCGVGNLTRDHNISNLILSTLEPADIEAIKRENYNENAILEQLDFLNFEKLPDSIDSALRAAAQAGKRLIFLMNPPYATAGILGDASKEGVADTLVNRAMKSAKIGACAQQLYAQFLFQAESIASRYGFIKKTIAHFSPSLLITGNSFKDFRDYLYPRYKFQSGFALNASQFSDVSACWSVFFTIWSEGAKSEYAQEIVVAIKDKHKGVILEIGKKVLYCSNGNEASKWVRQPINGLKTEDTPQMKSGLNIRQEGGRGASVKGALFYLHNAGNSIRYSAQLVGLYSTTFSNGNGLSVINGEGWRRAVALYSARKLSVDSWQTHDDEYLAPNTNHADYSQWVDDCHVFALLDTKNNMTSMRNVVYKDKKWTINNHFFWISRADALKIYDTRDSIAIFRDCKASTHEPYFAQILPTLKLSPLAREIMNELTELLTATLANRNGQDEILHLQTWDAGIYQLKEIWRDDPRWIEIKKKHKMLAEQLRHGVYTFGFLK
jgi:hypothetical protein